MSYLADRCELNAQEDSEQQWQNLLGSNNFMSVFFQRFTLGVRLYYKVMEAMLKSVIDLFDFIINVFFKFKIFIVNLLGWAR